MLTIKRWLALVPFLVAALGQTGAPARADTSLSGFGDIVVDDDRLSTVFVSEGPGGDEVVLHTLAGEQIGSIGGLNGPGPMAIAGSTLWVIERDASTLTEIDIPTRAIGRRIDVSNFPDPSSLVAAGGQLWFSFGCGATAGTAAFHPGSAFDPVDNPRDVGISIGGCPRVKGIPDDPGGFLVFGEGIARYRAAQPPVHVASRSSIDPILDVAAASDPNSVYIATANSVRKLRYSTLANISTLSVEGRPNALAGEGAAFIGRREHRVIGYDESQPGCETTISEARTLDRGLAVSVRADWAYIATASTSGVTLLTVPLRQTPRINVRAEVVPEGSPITVEVSMVGACPLQRRVELFRGQDADNLDLIATRSTDVRGQFTFTDFGRGVGFHRYRAAFNGDRLYRSAFGEGDAEVRAIQQTTLIEDGAREGLRGQGASLRVKLIDADGNALASKPVTLSLGDRSVTTTTDGAGFAEDMVQLTDPAGLYEARASFAGDAFYAPTSITWPLRIREPLTVTYTGPTTFDRLEPATLSARVTDGHGDPVADEQVTISFAYGQEGEVSFALTTDDNGIAEATFTPDHPGKTYTVRVTHLINETYPAAVSEASVKVVRWDARFVDARTGDRILLVFDDPGSPYRDAYKLFLGSEQWHSGWGQLTRQETPGGSIVAATETTGPVRFAGTFNVTTGAFSVAGHAAQTPFALASP